MITIRTSVASALIAITACAAAQDTGKTPAGAERAGNASGSIPAWPGNEVQQTGWSYGKLRSDNFKYKGDKSTLTIDASNADKYAAMLSPGQLAMLKQVKGYRMDVYPTRRTCGVPDFVAENTKKNAGGIAKIGPDGWSLQEAVVPGYPFPTPANGTEAMWNSKMRYRGVGVEYKNVVTSVSPRKGSTEWIRAGQEFTAFMPWGAKGSTLLSTLPPVEYFAYFAYSSPTALAGQALALTFFLNQPGSETFYYFPGQRRVRRMPTYAYDSPQIGMENQYTLDEPFVFNGTMDRFDWKLVGKKEMYVLYNAFGAYDFKAKFEDIAKPDFIDPGHRRYELHRVWVVEATVKQGMRHTAPKRTFYLDEDSWTLLVADDYDAQGKLAKMREGFAIPVYETGTCDVEAFVQNNLTEGRYVFDMHAAGTGTDVRWITEVTGARYKPGFYTADNLRAVSER
ncbi:DUF1329 domain-containing protein [Candidatus Aalborgicola defluviihabitans]|jgi:hypothetical protein|uniref:DUF1329 domain-containing protein n=1 Tax=Candidatus Aalborgicola defluviihabitans TaxID=3386187 RepID=UPI001D549975|nr:DUF1329 domain-containing protein [Burkholderiales bacterium]MBK6570304.1 DUF1329 domain-containing protein [Burkholderiales bacterium]MBK7279308.1 DUF1329 domain-containing protein [Burkholderiales bacterium]MBK7312997.1 DUF1329 domain-containing protein [Burkholderiales bacterium]MBL0243808.1 DUF1329 domain-containing protein [Rhodoferax sp.]